MCGYNGKKILCDFEMGGMTLYKNSKTEGANTSISVILYRKLLMISLIIKSHFSIDGRKLAIGEIIKTELLFLAAPVCFLLSYSDQ